MEDKRIVELFWARSEIALAETAAKYGNYLYRIASGILSDRLDAEECVNDTYTDAWNTMPPHRPSVLSTFLGKITRRISIDRWRKNAAEKRGGGEMALVWDELEDCVAGSAGVDTVIEEREQVRIIRAFLKELSPTQRRVFLRRYWYMDPVSEIASDFCFTESKTSSMLFRLRNRLWEKLKEEGYL